MDVNKVKEIRGKARSFMWFISSYNFKFPIYIDTSNNISIQISASHFTDDITITVFYGNPSWLFSYNPIDIFKNLKIIYSEGFSNKLFRYKKDMYKCIDNCIKATEEYLKNKSESY